MDIHKNYIFVPFLLASLLHNLPEISDVKKPFAVASFPKRVCCLLSHDTISLLKNLRKICVYFWCLSGIEFRLELRAIWLCSIIL